MNQRQIEAFRLVMLRGSMTAAAEELGTSQPSVSRLIAELEASTGLALLQGKSASAPLYLPPNSIPPAAFASPALPPTAPRSACWSATPAAISSTVQHPHWQ